MKDKSVCIPMDWKHTYTHSTQRTIQMFHIPCLKHTVLLFCRSPHIFLFSPCMWEIVSLWATVHWPWNRQMGKRLVNIACCHQTSRTNQQNNVKIRYRRMPLSYKPHIHPGLDSKTLHIVQHTSGWCFSRVTAAGNTPLWSATCWHTQHSQQDMCPGLT